MTTPSYAGARRRGRMTSMVCGAALLSATLCPTLGWAQSPSPDPDPPAADPWFGVDKALHFGAGFGIGVGGYALGAGPLESRWAGVGMGIGLAALIGGGKEGLDAAGLGQASWKDFLWDVIGGTLGVGVSLTFDAALRGGDR
jgi:putative lipoprotein